MLVVSAHRSTTRSAQLTAAHPNAGGVGREGPQRGSETKQEPNIPNEEQHPERFLLLGTRVPFRKM